MTQITETRLHCRFCFRRADAIAGEVGGQDVLGGLDALPIPEKDEPDLKPEPSLPPSRCP
jgi:hypothetical protein